MGSTVKVIGQACGLTQEGTAFVVAPHLVLTNAHVVAGEQPGHTEVITDGGTYAGDADLLRPLATTWPSSAPTRPSGRRSS